MTSFAERKFELRVAALERRRALDPAVRIGFSLRLIEQGTQLAFRHRPRIVSAFHPIRDEPDTLGLLAVLAREGFVTALPVTVSRAASLIFRRWSPGEPTVKGALNIPEPLPDAPEVDPDMLFVPLAAFDRRGHRIGYGAGHYDRSLARLRGQKPIHAIGIAYSACEVEAVPCEDHDQPLDYVLTEHELIDARAIR